MTVDAWLKALVGNHARAITWTGGACKLVNDLNPIVAAKWPWCAQATVLLSNPRDATTTRWSRSTSKSPTTAVRAPPMPSVA